MISAFFVHLYVFQITVIFMRFYYELHITTKRFLYWNYEQFVDRMSRGDFSGRTKIEFGFPCMGIIIGRRRKPRRTT